MRDISLVCFSFYSVFSNTLCDSRNSRNDSTLTIFNGKEDLLNFHVITNFEVPIFIYHHFNVIRKPGNTLVSYIQCIQATTTYKY